MRAKAEMPANHEMPTPVPATRMSRPLMLWRVFAKNPHEPPFHFSNVPVSMVIVAEAPDHARRIAMHEPGNAIWLDDERTGVVPERLDSPMVLARDFSV